MLKSAILIVSMLLGVLISAAVSIQRYMSLPPGAGEDMALVGLPYNCVLYGLLPGLVVGAVVARGVRRLDIHVSPAAKRRLRVGAMLAASLLVLLLFWGRTDVKALAVTVAPIVVTAQTQGSQALWNPAQPDLLPDLLVVALAPQGYGRIEYSDFGTYYYLAFCRARLRAGYPLLQAVRCTAEVRLPSQGQVHPAF